MRSYLIWLAVTALAFTSCTKKKEEPENSISHSFNATVKGLDPAQASDYYIHMVLSQINEGLLQYSYLKRPLQVEPLLAESMPTISKDGLTYTFKIKKGVKFQDDPCFKATGGKGRELTAEDFIYSFKRIADPANRGDGFWVFDGKVKGINEWRDKAAKGKADYSAAIEGLSAPDSHTLVIKLTQPYYQLLYVMTLSYAMAIPREAVEMYGAEYLNHPVGTGPFMLKEWVRNSKIVLVRNPNYRNDTYPTEGEAGDAEKGLLADAGKKIPFVDKVIFNEMPEDQPRWLTFMKGNADFNQPPKDNYDQVFANNELKPEYVQKGFQVQKTIDQDVTYDALNTDDPVLKNKYLRQAMSLATNRQAMIEKLYNGRAVVAHSPIPPGLEGYDPDFKSPYAEYNVSKAKELMKKAGFKEGEIVEINYEATSSATGRQFAEFVQQELAPIGVKINIKVNTWPEMTEKYKKKKAQMFGMAWLGDYPDAENFLQLFYGPNESPGPNSSNFKNKEFDALYKKAALLPPGPERTKVYQQMRDIIVEEVPWIFKTHRVTYMVYHSWLHNLKFDRTIYNIFKYLRVDAEKRAELKQKL